MINHAMKKFRRVFFNYWINPWYSL